MIGVAADGNDANAQVLQLRDGVLSGRQSFYLENQAERDRGEVAEEFIGQYYSASPAVPRTVIVGPYLGDRLELLTEALTKQRGGRVEVSVAERGDRRRLQVMAERNAELALGQETLRQEHRRRRRVEALAQLAESLEMEQIPVRIEGFDISNLGGTHTVASMVVFEEGRPKNAHYRHFKIRGDRSDGPDDFASMEEVLGRRMTAYLKQADLSPHDAERDESFAALPGLILIDGGPGQLAAGLRSLARFRELGVTIISLAKREEEVFLPGMKRPARIPRDSEASKLLQRVRDEAHRFAVTHHRGRRSRAATRSVLDELRGVGPVRKRALMRHFGSPDRLLAASREEIEAVPELPGKVARDIHDQIYRLGDNARRG